jgi:hypothetical protein
MYVLFNKKSGVNVIKPSQVVCFLEKGSVQHCFLDNCLGVARSDSKRPVFYQMARHQYCGTIFYSLHGVDRSHFFVYICKGAV